MPSHTSCALDAAYGLRNWLEGDVSWGVTGCESPICDAIAEVYADGYPLCIDCADKLLQRVAAYEIHPYRDLFPYQWWES